jgi:hypothetical protein
MTEHKTFKRRVRSRMAKTGESYTAARRMLIDEPREPAPAPPEPAREPDQEPVAKATGRSADSWFERLDQWGAAQRTATAPRSARYDWADGVTRVNVGFTVGATDKSRVALSHERLPDAAMAADRKRWWRERLVELKALLEARPLADA